MHCYPSNYDLFLRYQRCLYHVLQLQYINYQQYQQLKQYPPFATLSEQELEKIKQLEKDLNNKYYLIAFERTVKNLMNKLYM
ncbi:hypothetical protein [Anaerophilus nitritogenes]|uniref:hypothetical protein n=1 Tax=Anaerophilus nitritogenes TaxID=2498136 RepID=UPI00101E1672|nr:hypothetical protein [Anaerophilus nitritogenes]